MGRKKKELPVLEHITITGVAAEGKAIAKINDLVVFVPYVIPGDVVDLRLTRRKNSYAEALAIKIHTKSPLRLDAFCKHYGVCGGCKWQILPYQEQLKYKQKQVEDTLTRIGKVKLPDILPIIGSAKTLAYRNKLEYTFSNKRWLTTQEIQDSSKQLDRYNALGFHIPGAFDKVLHIERCCLQDDITNRIRNAVFQYACECGYPFIDLRTHDGILRNLIIRNSSTGELMVVLVAKVTNERELEILKDILCFIKTRFDEVSSLIYVINNKCNDSLADLDAYLYAGKDHIMEQMEGLMFKIGPKSFYQTNSEQAYELYKVVRDFAHLTGNETVYDLYTGTGTIANFIASKCKKVIGIEYVKEAIDDARVNSAINHINNTVFYVGDMKDVLTESFFTQMDPPDVVITDPPRAGMHPSVIEALLTASPMRIVYVSCNPATQARDLQLLDTHYYIEAVQPVDMFPHTQHVENVALLRLRNGIHNHNTQPYD